MAQLEFLESEFAESDSVEWEELELAGTKKRTGKHRRADMCAMGFRKSAVCKKQLVEMDRIREV